MAIKIINDTLLTDIAEAIRGKLGTTNVYKPSQMAEAIRGIPTGGAGTLYTVNFPTTANQTISIKCDESIKENTFSAEKGSTLSNLVVTPASGFREGKASISGGIKEFVGGGYCLLGDAIISVTDAQLIPTSDWQKIDTYYNYFGSANTSINLGCRQDSLKGIKYSVTDFTRLKTEVKIYTSQPLVLSTAGSIEVASQAQNHNSASWGVGGTSVPDDYLGSNGAFSYESFINYCKSGLNGCKYDTVRGTGYPLPDGETINAYETIFAYDELLSNIGYQGWIDGYDNTNNRQLFYGGLRLTATSTLYCIVVNYYLK